MIDRMRRVLGKLGSQLAVRRTGTAVGARAFHSKPHSLRKDKSREYKLVYPTGVDAHEARIQLYRFLRDNVPSLNAAVWTWVKMAAGRLKYTISDKSGKQISSGHANSVVDALSRRLYDNRYQKFGGIDALMVEFFNTLFVTGSVCGELLVDPTGSKVERFYFIDPASIRFRLNREGDWEMYQQIDDRKINLQQPSTFFYGLDANSVNPWGKSLLSAIPFAARVEQALVSDMNKSMHNAGYHRIHVKVKPPERMPGEDQCAYTSRANDYFDETVRMMKQIEPADNPITWDDVEIEYIGPHSRMSASSTWYLNHKAIVEDICVGAHLAPFMLGYSYGSTQTWAEFNFELLQRQLRTIQSAAVRFLRWITEVEFALQGIDATCVWEFDDAIKIGVLEKRKAESVLIDNVLKKLGAGLITVDVAREDLGC